MLVREIIEGISNKTFVVKDIAEKYNVSDRTVSTKIKNLGFKWLPKGASYGFMGDPETLEDVYNMEWESLFIPNPNTAKESKKADKSNISNLDKENHTSNIDDSIDKILLGTNTKDSRKYRGFYIDAELLSVIDKINGGNKSEFVNQCLRKVFEEKGLLI